MTAPTCTEAGYTTYTCGCGYSYREETEPALGHNFVDGFNNTRICLRCRYHEIGIEVPIDPDRPVVSYSLRGHAASSSEAEEERTLDSTIVQEYSYVYTGGSLMQMVITTTTTPVDGTATTTTETLNFAYDASGIPMSVDYNGMDYYYVTNIQGDVIAILNTSGEAVVEYTYDAWGNIHDVSGSLASTLGETNPLRYRGYVYDTEIGFYYLQSRYYNPKVGRFINADKYPSTGQGLLGSNMFTYCNNNPIAFGDPEGEIPILLTAIIGGAVAGALLGTVFYSVSCSNSGNKQSFWGTVAALVVGGVTGALAGAAGIVADATTKGILILSAGAISGMYGYYTGGSGFWSVTSGSIGAYLGTLFSTCGFTGFALGVSVYATSVITGMIAEGISQLGQAVFPESSLESDSASHSANIVPVFDNSESESKNYGTGGGRFRPITAIYLL